MSQQPAPQAIKVTPITPSPESTIPPFDVPGFTRWRWSFRGFSASAGQPVRAKGLLTTQSRRNPDGSYTICAITGRRNGVAITGLVPPDRAIPGNEDPVTGVPYIGDNRLHRNRGLTGSHLMSGGVQFSLADHTYSNVFFASFLTPPSEMEFHSAPPFKAGPFAPNTELAGVFHAKRIGC